MVEEDVDSTWGLDVKKHLMQLKGDMGMPPSHENLSPFIRGEMESTQFKPIIGA